MNTPLACSAMPLKRTDEVSVVAGICSSERHADSQQDVERSKEQLGTRTTKLYHNEVNLERTWDSNHVSIKGSGPAWIAPDRARRRFACKFCSPRILPRPSTHPRKDEPADGCSLSASLLRRTKSIHTRSLRTSPCGSLPLVLAQDADGGSVL